MDVVMPKESGPEVYRRMSAIRPNLPVLFVTGYDLGDRTRGLDDLSDGACFGLLQKPYTKATLSRRIEELLEMA